MKTQRKKRACNSIGFGDSLPVPVPCFLRLHHFDDCTCLRHSIPQVLRHGGFAALRFHLFILLFQAFQVNDSEATAKRWERVYEVV